MYLSHILQLINIFFQTNFYFPKTIVFEEETLINENQTVATEREQFICSLDFQNKNLDEKDCLEFFFHRLHYCEMEELVFLYNREVKIGLTYELHQTLFLLTLNFLFNKRLDKSPIEKVNGSEIKIIGEIYVKNDTMYFKENLLRKV